jgi:hypothetical protein
MAAFRRLLAEGMARVLGDKDIAKARESLDYAEAFLRDRSVERARVWYMATSFAVSGLALLSALTIWILRQRVIGSIGKDPFEVGLAGLVGALGALISIFSRTERIKVDAVAGRWVHCVESAARTITGVVGALLTALAVKANALLGVTKSSDHALAWLLFICATAGASERFVPNLIKQAESSTAEKPT